MNKAPYAGILAKPPKQRLDALWRTPACFRGQPDEWRRRLREAWLADARDFFDACIALFRHFNIDPAEPAAELRLALAMAGAPPVPAFTEPPQRGRPSKLGPLQTLRLLIACHEYEKTVYAATGQRPSRRGLAKEVANLPWVKEIGLKDKAARTIRNLLDDLQNAGAAYRDGKPSEYQRQVYEMIAPLLFNQARSGAQATADDPE
jgi:hypothetical protein